MGGMAATGAAMGNLADPMNPALTRPDPRDAEGQPGGFYGPPAPYYQALLRGAGIGAGGGALAGHGMPSR
jgi:hypothetical protein